MEFELFVTVTSGQDAAIDDLSSSDHGGSYSYCGLKVSIGQNGISNEILSHSYTSDGRDEVTVIPVMVGMKSQLYQ